MFDLANLGCRIDLRNMHSLKVDLRHCCAAILIGGESRRMGVPKALLKLDAKTLLDLIAEQLAPYFHSLLFVGNLEVPPEIEKRFGATRVPDLFELRSSKNGLLSAFGASSTDWTAMFACDAPRPCVPLLAAMSAAISEETKAVVCSDDQGVLQPFHALWHRSAAAVLEASLLRGELQLQTVLGEIPSTVLPPKFWSQYDPSGAFLLNLNTAEDLRKWSV
jgi:molybdopterin-guanine dinucleotide biosynthesis protein A